MVPSAKVKMCHVSGIWIDIYAAIQPSYAASLSFSFKRLTLREFFKNLAGAV